METGGDNSTVMVSNQGKAFQGGIRIENPFTFKVFQVFTGFGFGCGVGIGIGRPINLGAIPMVGQVMGATRGATDAFSGVSRHVNGALRKLGARNIEAGIGCGVGFGHGFGVGVAVKPRVVHQVQSCLIEAATKLMIKFGMASSLPIGEGVLPVSLQSDKGVRNELLKKNLGGSITQTATGIPDSASQVLSGLGNASGNSTYEKFASRNNAVETTFGSRTEQVVNSFLQNPLLKEDDNNINELAGRLRSENNLLQMVLKHQQIIEELRNENEKLRTILIEDLKIPPNKLEISSRNRSPCIDCFECRRKQRRSR